MVAALVSAVKTRLMGFAALYPSYGGRYVSYWMDSPKPRRQKRRGGITGALCLVGWVKPQAQPIDRGCRGRDTIFGTVVDARLMGFAALYPSYGGRGCSVIGWTRPSQGVRSAAVALFNPHRISQRKRGRVQVKSILQILKVG